VESKSILRAAAGAFKALHDNVDYFPSYELATHPGLAREMFEADRRSIPPEAVAYIMQHFLGGLGVAMEQVAQAESTATPPPPAQQIAVTAQEQDDIICEEMELEKFNADRD
jgi:hypothetical protein